jgi:hypothetical protein
MIIRILRIIPRRRGFWGVVRLLFQVRVGKIRIRARPSAVPQRRGIELRPRSEPTLLPNIRLTPRTSRSTVLFPSKLSGPALSPGKSDSESGYSECRRPHETCARCCPLQIQKIVILRQRSRTRKRATRRYVLAMWRKGLLQHRLHSQILAFSVSVNCVRCLFGADRG